MNLPYLALPLCWSPDHIRIQEWGIWAFVCTRARLSIQNDREYAPMFSLLAKLLEEAHHIAATYLRNGLMQSVQSIHNSRVPLLPRGRRPNNLTGFSVRWQLNKATGSNVTKHCGCDARHSQYNGWIGIVHFVSFVAWMSEITFVQSEGPRMKSPLPPRVWHND